MFSWILIVLDHCSNSSWVEIWLHMSTLSWFWVNQLWLLLLNAACLEEKQHIPMLYSLKVDLTVSRTHDLPNSRRARWSLHHRCAWNIIKVTLSRQMLVQAILHFVMLLLLVFHDMPIFMAVCYPWKLACHEIKNSTNMCHLVDMFW